MNNALEDVFKELDPPPGGLARLRARIQEDQRRVPFGRLQWVVTGSLITVTWLIWFLWPSASTPSAPLFDPHEMATSGLAVFPDETVAIGNRLHGYQKLVETKGVVVYKVMRREIQMSQNP